MPDFLRVILFTDTDGRARFRADSIPLGEGTQEAWLSTPRPCAGYQLRESPLGFRSRVHCTPSPQWVFILAGTMVIGLQDGSTRIFRPGQHFYSADVLPAGASFDPSIHGHWSAQTGPDALQTLFVKDPLP